MRLTRVIHPQVAVRWAPVVEIVPDLALEATDGAGAKVQMYAFAFTDPDGEQHVYLFDAAGREGLLRQLTGGIILPGS